MTEQGKQTKYPLFPHLESEEAQNAAAKAIEQRDLMDYRCFMLLREVFPYLEGIFDGISEEKEDLLDSIKEVLEKREESNEEFLRIVSGRPAKKETE